MNIGPLLYYMAHQADLERFIIIKTEGRHPHLLSKNDLSPLVENYIYINSHGVDEDKKGKYVKYICRRMMPILWK